MTEEREEERTPAGRPMTEEREGGRTTAGRQMIEEREGGGIWHSDDRTKIELVRAQERLCIAEGEAAERKAKAERDRMQMELTLIREKKEMCLLQRNFGDNNTSSVHGSKGMNVFPSMNENETPVSFFITFEKIARLHNIEQSEWPKLLPSLLNSTLRQHYNRLPYSICCDYKKTKNEILAACKMTPKFYLERMRSLRRSGQETFSQFLCRLRDVQEYYLEAKEITDFEGLKDDMLAELLKDTLQNEVKFFIEARCASSASEVAKFADLHFECTQEAKRGNAFERKASLNKPKPDFLDKSMQGVNGKFDGEAQTESALTNRASNGYNNTHRPNSQTVSNQFQTSKQTQDGCYTCGQFSHKWRQCPNNKSVKVSYFVHDLSHIDRINNYQNNFLMKVFLNDGVCLNALN